MITGISDVSIGDTVMSKETPIPLPPITVEVRSFPDHYSPLYELWPSRMSPLILSNVGTLIYLIHYIGANCAHVYLRK
jgi:hypothetical protein